MKWDEGASGVAKWEGKLKNFMRNAAPDAHLMTLGSDGRRRGLLIEEAGRLLTEIN